MIIIANTEIFIEMLDVYEYKKGKGVVRQTDFTTKSSVTIYFFEIPFKIIILKKLDFDLYFKKNKVSLVTYVNP